jgi:D-serine deaminase-like pyridoxal phosphate-dependent protein
MSFESLDTPVLLVDLDIFEQNIKSCFAALEGKNVSVRPHLKTGKSSIIAHRLLEAGAVGICVAKLGEAEVMAAAGIEDILITTELVGAPKLERLMKLLKDHPSVKLVVDNLEAAMALNAKIEQAGLQVGVLLDVNVGQNRCGVMPENALELALEISKLEHLKLIGVQGYEGHLQHDRSFENRRESCLAAMEKLGKVAFELENSGFEMRIVTTGGTGTYQFCAEHSRVTEVQPGSFIFMDSDYLATPGVPFQSALTVLSTVISVSESRATMPEGAFYGQEAILDAGLKSLSTDSGFAMPKNLMGWKYSPAGDEHGLLEKVDPEAVSLKIGDLLELIPSHIDTTLNLHDWYQPHRKGILEPAWKIETRGKIQ